MERRLDSTGAFFVRAAPALAFGFALALGSSAGQTFFISLSAGQVRVELGLSHGGFGGLYAVATVSSALILLWFGRLADRMSLTTLSVLALTGLSIACLSMASAQHAAVLVAALLGLRLFGQGMLSHISITAMGRWFVRERGRALSVATIGYPAGEAVLPATVAVLLTVVPWRTVWLGTAMVILVVLAPLVAILGRMTHERGLDRPQSLDLSGDAKTMRGWTRGEVQRDLRFYTLLPAVLAPPFILTGVLFHQVHLVATKGWSLPEFAATYPLFAAGAIAAALGAGFLIDRFGALRLVPVYLVPLGLGLFVLQMGNAPITAALFMLLMGCTSGGASIVLGALWPELYGTAHLGSIRALVMALMVLSTAVAPGIMGALLDLGVGLPSQLAVLSAYSLSCAVVLGLLLPRLKHR